jgi:hypothetical protein
MHRNKHVDDIQDCSQLFLDHAYHSAKELVSEKHSKLAIPFLIVVNVITTSTNNNKNNKHSMDSNSFRYSPIQVE